MKSNRSGIVIAVIILLLIAAGIYYVAREKADKEGDGQAGQLQTGQTAPATSSGSGEQAAEPETSADSNEQQQAEIRIPTFDVLRVEPDGTAVIAGAAEPDGVLDVKEGDATLASANVGATGDFVAIVETPLKPGDHLIYLNVTMPDGRSARSVQTATISIPENGKGELLTMITEPGKASEIITAPEQQPAQDGAAAESSAKAQPSSVPQTGDNGETGLPSVTVATKSQPAAGPEGTETDNDGMGKEIAATVSITAVEIEDNKLFIAGKGTPDTRIRGYIDDTLLGEATVNAENNYVLEAEADVSVGQHTIRVDMLDADGRVIARAIVPFDRPPGNQVAAVSAAPAASSQQQEDGTQTFVQPQLLDSDNAVIIRRGDNLWRISRRVYGRGVRYTTIYLANETQIVNPDIIQPGQVFSLPRQPLPIGEAETIHRRLKEGLPVGPEYHLPASDQ